MSKTFRNPKHRVVRFQTETTNCAKIGRPHSQIDNVVIDCAGQNSYQFTLWEFILVMETSPVVSMIYRYVLLNEYIFIPWQLFHVDRFMKRSALIAEHLWFYDLWSHSNNTSSM